MAVGPFVRGRVGYGEQTRGHEDHSGCGMIQAPYDAKFYAEMAPGSRRSAAVLLGIVFELLRPASVVDVGCGVGTWAAVAFELGATDVLGIDGDYVDKSQLQVPLTSFMPHDLRQPVALERRFDLAISLEVAEHLPAECAEGFVESLTDLAPVVLFSAAAPGQGGNCHLNEQWPAYWAQLFARHNFEAIDCLRPRVWNDERIEFWYRQNAIVYVQRDCLVWHPALTSASTGTPPLSLVHPEMLAIQQELLRQATWDVRRVVTEFPNLLSAFLKQRLVAAFRPPGRRLH